MKRSLFATLTVLMICGEANARTYQDEFTNSRIPGCPGDHYFFTYGFRVGVPRPDGQPQFTTLRDDTGRTGRSGIETPAVGFLSGADWDRTHSFSLTDISFQPLENNDYRINLSVASIFARNLNHTTFSPASNISVIIGRLVDGRKPSNWTVLEEKRNTATPQIVYYTTGVHGVSLPSGPINLVLEKDRKILQVPTYLHYETLELEGQKTNVLSLVPVNESIARVIGSIHIATYGDESGKVEMLPGWTVELITQYKAPNDSVAAICSSNGRSWISGNPEQSHLIVRWDNFAYHRGEEKETVDMMKNQYDALVSRIESLR